MTDLEAAADELYALAPEEFVAARTRLVKQARAAKHRALANEINALRKPTRTAWLVNALARDDPDAVAALLDLGDELRSAQQAKDGAALRALSARRRTAIDALVRRAQTIGEEAGHPATEATANEVAQSLQAALGDPAVAEQVRLGRLATAAVYGGFGGPAEDSPATGASASDAGGDLAALLAASMPAKGGGKQEAAPDEGAEQARREAAERRAALERARDEARQALDDAQDAADRATEEADRAAEEPDRLREEISRAEEAEREARTAARRAREQVRERRTAADEAEQALRDADG